MIGLPSKATTHVLTFIGRIRRLAIVAAALVPLAAAGSAEAFTLKVVDPAGNPVSGFRWLVERDNTHWVVPGKKVSDSISVNIHKSHAPVVKRGRTANDTTSVRVDARRRYFVSVLPDDVAAVTGFTMGGAQVKPGQRTVKVVVSPQPIPTAQISVIAFKDHSPINNTLDAGEEPLAGFTVRLSDAGGQMSQDAFGNPLGTTYQFDLGGNPLLNPDGSPIVDAMGTGVVTTGADGVAIIKNLAPGKYAVNVIPTENDWIQTSTIEGTLVIDAWVKAGEPPYFVEGWGTAFNHAAFGFLRQAELTWAVTPPAGTGSVSGQLVFNHLHRPPYVQGYFVGPPVDECWVGLNDLTAANKGLIALPCAPDSTFSIEGIPAGTYQLVWWDKPLDALFGFAAVTVGEGETVDLGQILANRWFGTLEGRVFNDRDRDGFPDDNEEGISNQTVNIRFRDGSLYQTTATDMMGEYSFAEVFPFFKWLVAEVDFARFKATGMTTAIDYGGFIPQENGWITPSFGKLTPQPQKRRNPNTGNRLSRTEKGPVLTQGLMLFLHGTNVIEWGKSYYRRGENGGISGIVYYDTTRAENDPAMNAGETWQPGIPRVQVNLYRDQNADGRPDDVNGDGLITRPDVDNYPLGNFPAGEDVDRNGDGRQDWGDAVNIAHTDSWDDAPPTGCIQERPIIHDKLARACVDNFGTWNQVRPGVFDGGYAFNTFFPAGPEGPEAGLARGTYVVESVPPPGYLLGKEEDKNVDFGDSFVPSPLLLPPACVGAGHLVPAELSLFPGVPTAFAGDIRPLCDRKQVILETGQNAAADFFFFTQVPKAGRIVGFVNNDLAAEFNRFTPHFGEKAAPSWLPISIQFFDGREVSRVYTDEFGSYNAMVPSSIGMNLPIPSGVSPAMYSLVLNHPFITQADGSKVLDPFYNPTYSTTTWTFQFHPGITTYLDTPVIPVGAFAGSPVNGADSEPVDGVPVVSSVQGPDGGAVACLDNATITITSMGLTEVPNPYYDPNRQFRRAKVTRDFSFGSVPGEVTVGGQPLTVVSWTPGAITATVPFATVSTGQLMVTRGDNGKSTEMAVTLHVGGCGANVIHVAAAPWPAHPLQDAIDAANPGDLILAAPGVYDEAVILWKPVRLQGSGAGQTFISAQPSPQDKLAWWTAKVAAILGPGAPNFTPRQYPGVLVLGNVPGFEFPDVAPANPADPLVLIDGFTLTGSVAGGGIGVIDHAHHLVISNNSIKGNQGTYGGGISVGGPEAESDPLNNDVVIRLNRIGRNGGVLGGGGISLYEGSTGYDVSDNVIVGNFSRRNGGGIMHSGFSTGGLISGNRILFNEVFFGLALGGDGGGIHVGGELIGPGLTTGSGSVVIDRNLIRGNLAGSGYGGGIRAAAVNGQDVAAAPTDPTAWHSLEITNNVIAGNVAAVAGAGLALQDTLRASIVNNTVAHNDSTATAVAAFTPGSQTSHAFPAGLAAQVNSTGLAAVIDQGAYPAGFSEPRFLSDNIFWQNRAWYFDPALNHGIGGVALDAVHPTWDLGVVDTVGSLNPLSSTLTDVTGYDGSNSAVDPVFVKPFVNTLLVAVTLDEGGNNISVRYRPLTEPEADYHLRPDSPAIDAASGAQAGDLPLLAFDYDDQARPNGSADRGADEFWPETFGDVRLLYPNGGETLPSGGTVTVYWGAPAGLTFDLLLSTNRGATWKKFATGLTGSWHEWNLPVPENNLNRVCMVRVVARDGAGEVVGRDASDKPFSIFVVEVMKPNTNEIFHSGEFRPIIWKTNATIRPVRKVKIYLADTRAGTRTLIKTFTGANPGTFDWKVPPVTGIHFADKILIVLEDRIGRVIGSDASDVPFIIRPAQ